MSWQDVAVWQATFHGALAELVLSERLNLYISA